jgi:hypothetical protein
VSSVDAEFTVRLKAPNGQETNLVRLPIESGRQRTVSIESPVAVLGTIGTTDGYLWDAVVPTR